MWSLKCIRFIFLWTDWYLSNLNIVSKTVPSNDAFWFFLLCALLVQQHFVTIISTEILTWLWTDFNRPNFLFKNKSFLFRCSGSGCSYEWCDDMARYFVFNLFKLLYSKMHKNVTSTLVYIGDQYQSSTSIRHDPVSGRPSRIKKLH